MVGELKFQYARWADGGERLGVDVGLRAGNESHLVGPASGSTHFARSRQWSTCVPIEMRVASILRLSGRLSLPAGRVRTLMTSYFLN